VYIKKKIIKTGLNNVRLPRLMRPARAVSISENLAKV